MNTVIDLNALEKAALAATQGPWHSPGIGEVHSVDHSVIVDVCFPCDDEGLSIGGGKQEDADFIALANPVTVLNLIQRIRELEKEQDSIIKIARIS